jgi:hypothetical protein
MITKTFEYTINTDSNNVKSFAISHDGTERVCITDMWKATGAIQSRRPSKWRETKEFKNFLEELKRHVPKDKQLFFKVGNETWAFWQLAMAYAKYLSPSFHLWCNQVIKDYMEKRTECTTDVVEQHTNSPQQVSSYKPVHPVVNPLAILEIVKSHAQELIKAGLPKNAALNVVTGVVNTLCNVSFPMLLSAPEVTKQTTNLIQLPRINGTICTSTLNEDATDAQVIPLNDTTDYMHVSTWLKRDVIPFSSKEKRSDNEAMAKTLRGLGLETTDITSALRALRIHPGKTAKYEPTELELKEIFKKYAKKATENVSVLVNNVPTEVNTHGGYLFNLAAMSAALEYIKEHRSQLNLFKK